MLILLQSLPRDIEENDIHELMQHLQGIQSIHIERPENETTAFAWVKIDPGQCDHAGLNAICQQLDGHYFRMQRIRAYPVLFSD